jgi:hypothetical protein
MTNNQNPISMIEKLLWGSSTSRSARTTGTWRWRLAALFALWMALPGIGVAQAPEKWQRLPMVTQADKDYFAARAGNPQFPEASNFLGGEGGQWPQGWAISADGNVLLWGTDVGGIARSRDGGTTWEPANFGFNARGGVAFAIDPRNPDRAIAIGGNGGRDWVGAHGIYVTENLKSDMPQWSSKRAVNVVGYRDIREQVDYDRSSYDAAAGYCKTAYWSRGYFDWHDASAKHNAIYKTVDGGETWAELHLDVAATTWASSGPTPRRASCTWPTATASTKAPTGRPRSPKNSPRPSPAWTCWPRPATKTRCS